MEIGKNVLGAMMVFVRDVTKTADTPCWIGQGFVFENEAREFYLWSSLLHSFGSRTSFGRASGAAILCLDFHNFTADIWWIAL